MVYRTVGVIRYLDTRKQDLVIHYYRSDLCFTAVKVTLSTLTVKSPLFSLIEDNYLFSVSH